ncbi:MAG: hypothetical protein OXM55_01680 [Bdellovibrionales bacterium]|nr:hypothetical protein [Bdellovibrionales bacterium]
MKKLFPFLVFLFFLSEELLAKPEYAVRIRANRCTTCHSSPAGGGHRNLTGKAFGPKSAPLKSFSEQDIFGFDLRAIAYTPLKNVDKQANGLGVMAAIPSVSIPFHSNDKGLEWRLVYSQNIGGFGGFTTPRDAYLRVKLYDDYRAFPQFITIGRFSPPFGLMTDEHRTYVRQQTKTSWNEQEMGILLSGDWSYKFHYDIAIVNGEQTKGQGFGEGLIYEWGAIANIRYLANWGWMAGVSGSAHHCVPVREEGKKCAAAASLYQVLSLDSLTNSWLPGALLAEAVAGYNTNSHLQGTKFVSNLNYLTSVLEDKYSVGARVQWNYNFFPDWTFVVKYDYLTLDWEYRKDAYYRVGAGLNHFFNNQTSLQVRYEKAFATPADEVNAEKKGFAGQDIIWLLLQVKI